MQRQKVTAINFLFIRLTQFHLASKSILLKRLRTKARVRLSLSNAINRNFFMIQCFREISCRIIKVRSSFLLALQEYKTIKKSLTSHTGHDWLMLKMPFSASLTPTVNDRRHLVQRGTARQVRKEIRFLFFFCLSCSLIFETSEWIWILWKIS